MTTSSGSGTLPDFAHPPVVEVALGVEFAPLGFGAIDLGDLRDRWRADYPEVQEQGPLPPSTDEEAGAVPVISFGPPPMNRHWFLSTDRTRLLQVQQDRLVLNWRRAAGDDGYPRYPTLRDMFRQHLEEFEAFASAYGELRIARAEVTYINDLSHPAETVARQEAAPPAPPDHLHDFVELWKSVPGHHLGEPSQVQFAATFRRESDRGVLQVRVDPAPRVEDGKMTRLLTLTARGRPTGGSIPEALDFLDEARVDVVTSFVELTTPMMHQRWGLR